MREETAPVCKGYRVMFGLLDSLLARIVERGSLSIRDAEGKTHRYGDGSGSPIALRLADKGLERGLVYDPQLALGEGYMQGRLIFEEGDIYELMALLFCNIGDRRLPAWANGFDLARYLIRRVSQFNPARRAAKNAAHHYDIDGAIYDLFLDRDRQYSCAYFMPGVSDLDQAQLDKKRHIAAKLALEPGQRLLDIGSGWGGLGIYLAKVAHCDVTGVTLSSEQLRISRERALKEGLARAVHFEFKDYRSIEGRFERIVSVGMFEHVGINHYASFFRKVRELLSDDGIALIHTIGRSEPPTVTNPFIAKYIFPGGYIPALSEVSAAIERSGLIISDLEILRLHYAETLRLWRKRFLANWDIAARIRDAAFCRMWEFYLAASEAAFRYQRLVVFQVQLQRRIDTVPLTRDYIGEAEQRLRHDEALSAKPRMAGE